MKKKKSISLFMALLMLLSVLVEPFTSTVYAESGSNENAQTINEFLGVDAEKVVPYLIEHQKKFLGTPYSAPGALSPGGAYWKESNTMNPGVHFNCTGFVAYTLRSLGGDLDRIPIGRYTDITNLSRWAHGLLYSKKVKWYMFDSVQAMLASGKAQKGDIIILDPKNWNQPGVDNHVGFFWGDSPSDNKFWHSDSKGNRISNIVSKHGIDCYVWLMPLTRSVKIKPSGKFQITKKHNETGQGLSGFKYRVSGPGIPDGKDKNDEEKYVTSKTFTTNAEGTIKLDKLKEGAYTIEEIAPANTFLFPKQRTKTVKISNQKIGDSVNFIDEQQYFDFSIQKKFANLESGDAKLEGAKFKLTCQSLEYEGIANQTQPGGVVGTYTTNADGAFSVHDLPLGTYTLEEVEAPYGTLLSGEKVTIHARYDGTQNKKTSKVTYDFSSNKKYTDALTDTLHRKLNVVWNALLPQDKIGTKTYTDAQCGIERTPQIKDNDFFNHVFKGRVEISKHRSDDGNDQTGTGVKIPEEGILFKIFRNGKEVDSFRTNQAGRGSSKYLPIGEYVLTQHSTVTDDDGNHLVTKVKDIPFAITKDGQVFYYSLENAPQRMRLRIHKLDAVTGKNILQKGVRFQLYKQEGDKLVTFTQYSPDPRQMDYIELSGNEGSGITIDRLKGGKYYLKEIAGPKGYKYDENHKFEFVMPYDLDDLKSWELPVVDITIGDKTEPVANMKVNNVPQYGELTIHKTGELLVGWDTQTVKYKVQDKGTLEKTIESIPQSKTMLLVQVASTKPVKDNMTEVEGAAGNGKTSPQSHIASSEQTQIVTREFVDVHAVLTDENGKYEKEVGPGEYIVYGPNKEVLQKLKVEAGKKGLLSVSLPDIKQTKEVRHDGKVYDKEFKYAKAHFDLSYLKGAKFELIAQEDLNSYDKQTKFFAKGDALPIAQADIKDETGKVLYHEGEVITLPKLSDAVMKNTKLVDYTITTKPFKPVKISRIPLGKVVLRETQAPRGYKLDTKEREFTFSPQAHTSQADVQETERIENKRQILKFHLDKKKVEETKYFDRGGYDYIVFGLFNKNDIKGLSADQNANLKKDTLVGVVKPDENGLLKFDDVLEGEYYIKEISTKDAYLLNHDVFEMKAEYDDNSTDDKIIEKKTDIVNKPVEGKPLSVKKVDAKTGKALANVEFKLWAISPNGTKTLVKNGKSEVWITDKNGQITTHNLPYGSYEWEEVKASSGYVTEQKRYLVAVSDESSLEITATNSATFLGFRKYDLQTGKPVIGARLRLEFWNIDKWETVMKDEQGYMTKQGGEPMEWLSDNEMETIYGLDFATKYRLVEVNAPDGYATAEPLEFTVTDQKGLQLESMGDQMIRGKILKLDESSQKPVIGAKLALFEEGSDKPFVDKVTGKEAVWTTTNEGYIINGLIAGRRYIIREEITPAGYHKPYYEYIAIVVDKAEVQTFSFYNEPIPTIKTHATFESGAKEYSLQNEVTLNDAVKMTKLVPGAVYTAKASLMADKEGKNVLASGELQFTATAPEMNVTVPMKVNAKALAGTKAVVFEELWRDGRLVADHKDLQDKDQTVYLPEIKTKVGSRSITADAKAKQTDTVYYKALEEGVEHTIHTYLVDKATGEPLKINGKLVEVWKTFTPAKDEGSETVEMVFDASKLAGKQYVVFEEVYVNDVLTGEHKDLKDANQTFSIEEMIHKPRTGQEEIHKAIWLGLGCAALAGAVGAVLYTRKRKQK